MLPIAAGTSNAERISPTLYLLGSRQTVVKLGQGAYERCALNGDTAPCDRCAFGFGFSLKIGCEHISIKQGIGAYERCALNGDAAPCGRCAWVSICIGGRDTCLGQGPMSAVHSTMTQHPATGTPCFFIFSLKGMSTFFAMLEAGSL